MTLNRPRRVSLLSLLLLTLLARALVPTGFMPAGDGSAQLMLCPDGMLMSAETGKAAGTPVPGHVHTDHCPFGAAPFAAPLASQPLIPLLTVAVSQPLNDPASRVPGARTARTHQPRAPPRLNLV